MLKRGQHFEGFSDFVADRLSLAMEYEFNEERLK